MKNLDLLRTVAVLCVFSSHLIGTIGPHQVGSLGRFGVITFFVHTSLVLMGSLERLEKSGLRDPWRLSAAFYIRRLFRIYPLAVFVILLIPVFHIPRVPLEMYHWVGAKAFLSNLSLSENMTHSPDILGPLWSLPLEVQMYCMLPLTYFVIRKGEYRGPGLWMLFLILALATYGISPRLNVFTYAPCFVSGIVAYDLARAPGWKMPAWTFPVALLALIIAFGPLDDVGLTIDGKLPRAWGVSLVSALVIARTRDGALPAVQPVAHWIAEHSFGIYLSHVIVFWVAFNVMKSSPSWLKFLMIACGSVGVPILLYRYIEKPFIGVGTRVANLIYPSHSKIPVEDPDASNRAMFPFVSAPSRTIVD
jgi:peptidoglycan/LPS O-acetylase OafA/YrhL